LVPEKGTYTHPGRAQRIAAVQKGWNDAKQRNKKNEPIPIPNVPVRSSSEVESMVNQALKLYDTKQWAEAYYILIRPQISEIAISQFILGKLFRGGLGVSQDYTIAVKWFRSAAEQGNADAQQALAEMLNMGYGVPENSVEAVKWTRKAAEQGNRQAQYDMGAVYEYGVGGLQTNVDEAIKWYRKAAEQGHPLAKKDLKRLLEK